MIQKGKWVKRGQRRGMGKREKGKMESCQKIAMKPLLMLIECTIQGFLHYNMQIYSVVPNTVAIVENN